MRFAIRPWNIWSGIILGCFLWTGWFYLFIYFKYNIFFRSTLMSSIEQRFKWAFHGLFIRECGSVGVCVWVCVFLLRLKYLKRWESMEGVKEAPPSLTDPIISLLLAMSRDPQESVTAAMFLFPCCSQAVVWFSQKLRWLAWFQPVANYLITIETTNIGLHTPSSH